MYRPQGKYTFSVNESLREKVGAPSLSDALAANADASAKSKEKVKTVKVLFIH